MGFTEMLMIAVVAILFLGPDKLPQTMVEIARIIKKVKNVVSDAKESIHEELHLADIKEEALSYKKELAKAGEELKSVNPINNVKQELYDVTMEAPEEKTAPAPQKEEVTFKKKEPKDKEENA